MHAVPMVRDSGLPEGLFPFGWIHRCPGPSQNHDQSHAFPHFTFRRAELEKGSSCGRRPPPPGVAGLAVSKGGNCYTEEGGIAVAPWMRTAHPSSLSPPRPRRTGGLRGGAAVPRRACGCNIYLYILCTYTHKHTQQMHTHMTFRGPGNPRYVLANC